jgi:hypothetical protein
MQESNPSSDKTPIGPKRKEFQMFIQGWERDDTIEELTEKALNGRLKFHFIRQNFSDEICHDDPETE